MSGHGLDRREFLQFLGGGALSALVLAGAAATRLACSVGGDPLLAAVTAFFDEPERAARIGAAWLAEGPAAVAGDALPAALFGDDLAAARELATRDPAALHAQLRARHQSDFAADRTTQVAGFVLSLTEARLCALVSRG